MTTTHTHIPLTLAIGAAIAGALVPALLFVGAGTAQAIEDHEDTVGLPYIEQHPANTWAGFPDPGPGRPGHDRGTDDRGVIAIVVPPRQR